MYDASFAVLGPKLWNLVPATATSVKDIEVFKAELNKNFLSKRSMLLSLHQLIRATIGNQEFGNIND